MVFGQGGDTIQILTNGAGAQECVVDPTMAPMYREVGSNGRSEPSRSVAKSELVKNPPTR